MFWIKSALRSTFSCYLMYTGWPPINRTVDTVDFWGPPGIIKFLSYYLYERTYYRLRLKAGECAWFFFQRGVLNWMNPCTDLECISRQKWRSMHCCLRYPRCFWQSVAQRSSCQTEIKRGVRYASQMVAELSSWKVHQGCSFWPIIWCFTHQCLGTTRLHTWPSSILCLHRWPSGHLRKPAIPVCWWLYTVCTNKICKRKGKCCSQFKQRSRENEGMGYQLEGYLWTHKM